MIPLWVYLMLLAAACVYGLARFVMFNVKLDRADLKRIHPEDR